MHGGQFWGYYIVEPELADEVLAHLSKLFTANFHIEPTNFASGNKKVGFYYNDYALVHELCKLHDQGSIVRFSIS